jgi:hypothetical protein
LAVNQTLSNELREARLKVDALQKQQEKLESRLKQSAAKLPKNINITVNNSNYACMQYGGNQQIQVNLSPALAAY